MMCLVKNFGWLTHLFIFFFNVITNTPEMTSGEKKNFPATCSHTQEQPTPHYGYDRYGDGILPVWPEGKLMALLNSVPIMGETYDITSSLLFMMNLQIRHVKMETCKRINTNHQYDHPKLGLKLKGQRIGLKPLKGYLLGWLFLLLL